MFDIHITGEVPEGIDPAVLYREVPIDCFRLTSELLTSPLLVDMTQRKGNHTAFGGIPAPSRATDKNLLAHLDSRLKTNAEMFRASIARFADPKDEIYQNFAGLKASVWHIDPDTKTMAGIMTMLSRDETERYRFSIVRAEETAGVRDEAHAFYTGAPFDVGFALRDLFIGALARPNPAHVLDAHPDFALGKASSRAAS